MWFRVVAFAVCAIAGPLAGAEAVIGVRVVDENKTPVPGASVTLQPPAGTTIRETSDLAGVCTLRVETGQYLLTVQHEGYFTERDRPVEVTGNSDTIEVSLPRIRQTSESINVNAEIPPVDMEGTASVRRVTGRQILEVPYPATRNFRNALRIMPGVMQGRGGRLHFDGAMENQVFYSLNGFNIGDPITGRFTTRLTVEAIRSIDYSSGRYSPEFGKGSAGTLGIQTVSGDDRLRYAVTNFIPGIETRTGLHVGTWAPRFTVSGPIQKGRAWFSESIDAEYNTAVILELPPGQNRMVRVRGGSILHGQVNLTPSNILSANFLTSRENNPRSGLSALDPLSTSQDRRAKQYFWSLKDQIFLPYGMIFEAGFAQTNTESDERPQGTDFYRITPDGRSGNNFLNMTQDARRQQVLANLFLPRFRLAGYHQLKTGIDLDWLEYLQDSRRSGYENYSASGRLLSRVTFGGPNALKLRNTEASTYLVDVWEVTQSLRFEYGVRQDWDHFVGRQLLSPRAAVAFSPARWQNTRFSGGFAVVHDASTLSLFARPLDQYSIATSFREDGSILKGPEITLFRADNADRRGPRYRNWSFGVEQKITPRMRVSMNLLRRRGQNGFTYLPVTASGEYDGFPVGALLQLTNDRKDIYDSASLTLHHSFGAEYEYMVSYTRSRALSNAVVDFNVDEPLKVYNNFGRQPWDAPNRVMSWGYLPAWSPKWAVAYLCEWRNGFPFSIQRETGEVVGQVNSQRFPVNFDLNLHLERKLHWGRHKFAVRGGFNNITNSFNPTGVNNVIDSPRYGLWYGKEGRHFVFRLRWLSKE